jgi:hypothetical protein
VKAQLTNRCAAAAVTLLLATSLACEQKRNISVYSREPWGWQGWGFTVFPERQEVVLGHDSNLARCPPTNDVCKSYCVVADRRNWRCRHDDVFGWESWDMEGGAVTYAVQYNTDDKPKVSRYCSRGEMWLIRAAALLLGEQGPRQR